MQVSDILSSDAKRLATTLGRDLVKPTVDLNLGEPANGEYPLLELALPDDTTLHPIQKGAASGA